jgi:hypothetical protein
MRNTSIAQMPGLSFSSAGKLGFMSFLREAKSPSERHVPSGVCETSRPSRNFAGV